MSLIKVMSTQIPFPSYLEQKRQLTQWKKTNSFYREVYSQTTQDVVKRLHNTWEAFRKRGYGFPRFRKYGQYRSFYYPQFKDNPITGSEIKLPKIGMEDIDFTKTAKAMLGKQMLDGGFGQFRQLLKWVGWKRDVYVAEVDHRYTSQICPHCGTHTGKKELSLREHKCPECGYSTTRDRASAMVIKQRGEETIVPVDTGERKLSAECVLLGVNRLGKCNAEMLNCEIEKPALYSQN